MEYTHLVVIESQRDEARREAAMYRELLVRIRAWDHLDFLGDGPFWKREIDAVLKG